MCKEHLFLLPLLLVILLSSSATFGQEPSYEPLLPFDNVYDTGKNSLKEKAREVSANDFWNRFNNVYDIGKNFLDDTARGSGRISPHQGAYTYRYDFPLPPSRNGMAPKLALVYSSQGRRSYLGEGWSLTIPRIQRSTKFGRPSYTFQDQFDYYDENGGIHHLVPVEETATEIRYRRMSESEFSWFKYNKQAKTWTILRKDGFRLDFRTSFSPEVPDPSPMHHYTPERFTWYLSEEKDSTGNTVTYFYKSPIYKSEYIVAPVISHVVYTGNVHKPGWKPTSEVKFNYYRNPEPRILDCRSGYCEKQDFWQLNWIDVSVINNEGNYTLRKRFRLEYDQVDHHKVLSRVIPIGWAEYGHKTKLPPISFTYAPLSNSSPVILEKGTIRFPDDAPQFPYVEYRRDWGRNTTQTLADMDGDGIKDFVVYDPDKDVWAVYFGRLSGGNSVDMRFVGSEIWGYYDIGSIRSITNFPIDVFYSYSKIGADLVDINGDGRPDRIKQAGYGYPSTSSSFPYLLEVALNNGHNFDSPILWRVPYKGISCEWRAQHTTWTKWGLVDMNGDGLPDFVGEQDKNSFIVYLNNSRGFDPAVSWPSPVGSSFNIVTEGKYQGKPARVSILDFVDMNGDGLPDLVYQPDSKHFDDPIRVYLNTGNGFVSFSHDWNLSVPISVSGIDSFIASDKLEAFSFFIDFNSDGLPDYLYQERDSSRWYICQNLGLGFSSPRNTGLKGSLGQICDLRDDPVYTKDKLLDINGDGILDLVSPFDEYDPETKRPWLDVWWGTYTQSLCLVSVENGYGGQVEIEYVPASVTEDHYLPVPIQVVSSVKTSDAFSDYYPAGHKVKYNYRGGFFYSNSRVNYFHPANKEFRGFETVETRDSEKALLVEQSYYQDDYKNGYLFRETYSRLSNGKIIRRNYTGYKDEVIESDTLWNTPVIMFWYPAIETDFICNEKSEPGQPGCTKTKIARGFDSNGNLISITDLGVDSRNGRPEPYDDTITIWGYKSKIDLEHDIYIFAPSYKESVIWGDNNNWIQDGLIHYYHDGGTAEDYITQGLLTKIHKHTDLTTYYESTRSYDTESGLLRSETDFNNNETIYTYDELTNTFVATKTRGGLTERFESWDIATGKNTRYCDPNDVCWESLFDGFGRLREEAYVVPSQPNQLRIKTKGISYYDRNRPAYIWEVSTIDQHLPWYLYRRTYYSGLGNPIQRIENHDGVDHIIQSFGYDMIGRLQKVSVPEFRTGWEYTVPDWTLVDHTTIHYDPLDRLTEISRPCTSGNTRRFSFGGDLSTTMIDEEGNKLSTIQDAHGNITEVIRYSSNDKIKNIFEYDGHDEIIKATDHLGHEINYERDWLGRIRSVSLSGLPEGKAWTFDYDGNGNLTPSLSPAGREISYVYDPLDRISRRDFKINEVSEGNVEYKYDEPTSFGKGRLTFARSPGGTATYFYDPRGNVLKYQTTNGVSNKEYELSFTYNEADEIKTLTYPDGTVYHYTYNHDGTVKSLIREEDRKVIAKATYNARRQITSITSDFRTEYSFAYDTCGRPTLLHSSAPTESFVDWPTTMMDRSISYYKNDKIRSIHDKEEIGPGGTPLEIRYDPLLRLQSVIGQAYKVNYTYDWADRLTHMDRDGRSIDFSYEDERFPWAVTSKYGDPFYTRYIYDDDGFLTSIFSPSAKIENSFDFDARGLIRGARHSVNGKGFWNTWEYDHLDRPVNKQSITGYVDYVDKYYDLSQSSPSHLPVPIQIGRKFLFFAGSRIAVGVSNKLDYIHPDQMGSIRYITGTFWNADVETHHYYPYGEEYHTSVSTKIDFRFNDRKNEGYGLYRFPKRMYNPSSHQWVSLDPAVLMNPLVLVLDGVNPYAYCRNDPINRSDLSGLESAHGPKIDWLRIVIPIHTNLYRIDRSLTITDPIGKTDIRAATRASFAANLSIKNIFIAGAFTTAQEITAAVMGKAIGKIIGPLIGGALKKFFESGIKTGAKASSAYEIAQQGGKHSGWLNTYRSKSATEIQKSIKSMEKLIAEHQAKIKDPSKFIEDFHKLDPRQQKALIERIWPSHIARQQEQIDILRGILGE